MQTRTFIIGVATLALTGCISQSQIQAKYVKSKDICRTETSKLFAGGGDSNATSAYTQAAVNSRFTECMTKAGWRTPKQVAQTQNPPSGSPSTAPSAAAARQRPAENPPSGAPSTQPSAAAAVKQAPPPAPQAQPQPVRNRLAPTEFGKQPARPPSVPAAPYGSAGRSF